MDCEVCGKTIMGNPFKAIIEGTKLLVCYECSHHSSATWRFDDKRPKINTPKKRISMPNKPILQGDLELLEDYGKMMRKARENLGLSHEELGRRIGEKVSVLRKLETNKMTPSVSLTAKLERILDIKLQGEYKTPQITKEMLAQKPYERVLGDIAILQNGKRKVGAGTKREQ